MTSDRRGSRRFAQESWRCLVRVVSNTQYYRVGSFKSCWGGWVRSRVSGWLGLGLFIVGVALTVASQYWLATRTFVPLDIPVSLARGHIRSGEFKINLDATYWIDMHLDPNSASCDSSLQTQWTARLNGKSIAQSDQSGSNAPTVGYSLGMFSSISGRGQLNVDVLSDSACLNVANPHLRIEAVGWSYEDASESVASWFCFGLLLATVGASLLVLSSFGSNRRWPQQLSLKISAPRANHMRIQRRDSTLLDPRSTIPLVGYLYAVTWMVAFLLMAPFILATWQASTGLPAHLIRPGVILSSAGGETGLLVYIDQSGSLYLNSNPITAQELPKTLGKQLAQRADRSVYVEGDPTGSFGEIVQAVDLVRAAQGEVILMTPRLRAEATAKPR